MTLVPTNLQILRQIAKYLRENNILFSLSDGQIFLDGNVICPKGGYVVSYMVTPSGVRVVYHVHFVSAKEWYRKYHVRYSRLIGVRTHIKRTKTDKYGTTSKNRRLHQSLQG